MRARDEEYDRDGQQPIPDQQSHQYDFESALGFAEDMHRMFSALSDRLENAISKRSDGLERNQQNRRSEQDNDSSGGNEETVHQARRGLTRPATSLSEQQTLGLADCAVNRREGSVTSTEQGSVPQRSSLASIERRSAEDIVEAINLQTMSE